jgi:hypothetical protein
VTVEIETGRYTSHPSRTPAPDYKALARELLADPLELIDAVLVKHTAAMLSELHAMRRAPNLDERRAADKRQREADTDLQVATFAFDEHEPEHAKRLLFGMGWIAGAYHARMRSNAEIQRRRSRPLESLVGHGEDE